MISGKIVRNSLKSAMQEHQGGPGEVFCRECGEVTHLTVVDFGYGDAFGGVVDWRVVTACCNGEDVVAAECQVCHKGGALVQAPEWSDHDVVCTKCLVNLLQEREEDMNRVKRGIGVRVDQAVIAIFLVIMTLALGSALALLLWSVLHG